MARKQYQPQDRLGIQIGDRVKVVVDPTNWYRGVGVVVGFLNNKFATNNGAALVEIKNPDDMTIRPYINVNQLAKV